MEIVNLLEFINKAKNFDTLEYAVCDKNLVNFLDKIVEDEQFTRKIDLGLFFVNQKTLDQYVVIDGLGRLLSVSLLLHAVCECYKKTTKKNEKAISTIRKKYLIDGAKTKLRLPENSQVIYEKILFGERLSGREKESPIFILLHELWQQIKNDKLQAGNILKMLQKMFITVVDSEDVPVRDLYITLNNEKREINQLLLIEDYLKSIGLKTRWEELKSVFDSKSADLKLFFKDFFITKFNFKEYSDSRIYEIFVNYFETMLQYMPEDILLNKVINSAKLYHNILNVNFADPKLKQALIRIKMHNGEDTYAYLLNIYEDYIENNITDVTFLEILSTIDEYLKNREKTPNNVSFNELIQYLNAFITCK